MEYTHLIPQFSNLLITVMAFILCLSIIVFVHEFGHYYIGKLSGIHAEVFSIGFGPVLLSYNDKNGTSGKYLPFRSVDLLSFWGIKIQQVLQRLSLNRLAKITLVLVVRLCKEHRCGLVL